MAIYIIKLHNHPHEEMSIRTPPAQSAGVAGFRWTPHQTNDALTSPASVYRFSGFMPGYTSRLENGKGMHRCWPTMFPTGMASR